VSVERKDDLVDELRQMHRAGYLPESPDTLAAAADAIERLTSERDQYKLAAETNHETIKRLRDPIHAAQIASEVCQGDHCWSGPFCVVCGESREWSMT
jgi:hypothetical protein